MPRRYPGMTRVVMLNENRGNINLRPTLVTAISGEVTGSGLDAAPYPYDSVPEFRGEYRKSGVRIGKAGEPATARVEFNVAMPAIADSAQFEAWLAQALFISRTKAAITADAAEGWSVGEGYPDAEALLGPFYSTFAHRVARTETSRGHIDITSSGAVLVCVLGIVRHVKLSA
jgi:hypothetical protein